MALIKVYTLRIDGRSKDIILSSLSDLQARVEGAVSGGAADEDTLKAYDEILQLRRGIALAPGEDIDTDKLAADAAAEEAPAVEPEVVPADA